MIKFRYRRPQILGKRDGGCKKVVRAVHEEGKGDVSDGKDAEGRKMVLDKETRRELMVSLEVGSFGVFGAKKGTPVPCCFQLSLWKFAECSL